MIKENNSIDTDIEGLKRTPSHLSSEWIPKTKLINFKLFMQSTIEATRLSHTQYYTYYPPAQREHTYVNYIPIHLIEMKMSYRMAKRR